MAQCLSYIEFRIILTRVQSNVQTGLWDCGLKMSTTYLRLLQPGKIGNIEIPNRIIKAPQSTGLSNVDGSVSERLIRHYRELARGGTGLIIVEYAYIDKIASKSAHCQLGISDNEHISGLAWLAQNIREEGCRAAIQIEHCGSQKLLGTPPIKAASAVTWPLLYRRMGADAVPEPLTIPEIEAIIKAFGDAALRAKTAGFELVEIHGAHGYLITNFLSPHTNKRHDIYGGPLENRMRLLIQVYESVRRNVGDDFPVSVRLSGTDYEPDGFGIEETIEVCKVLESKGINAIHVSGGDNQQLIHQISPMAIPVGHNVWAAEAIKKAVRVPVIASGSITTPELAADILATEKADFIGLGRPLWADQHWVKKLREDRPEDIRPCIRCNEGCLERSFFKFRAVTCAVNPTVGREGELEIELAEIRKNIAIVGGGPAGMEAARVCAIRGHEVTLYEKRRLGGSLLGALVPRFKSDIKPFLNYLQTQILKLNVRIIEAEATIKVLQNGGFDTVIIATGTTPVELNVAGIDKPFVYNVSQVLENGINVGKKVIVVGGGIAGIEAALWLDEHNKEVVVVEMKNQIMMDCTETDKTALSEKLAISQIKVYTGNKLEEIVNDGIIVRQNEETFTISGDTVVLAVGHQPVQELTEKLRKKTKLEVYTIGDCVNPGKIFDAIHTAYKTARRI